MHQFVHISGYGHKARPGQPRHATASAILGEAVRRPGSTGHLPQPKAAKLVFGDAPKALFERLAHVREQARDSIGRRLRADGSLIMIAVVSYPQPRNDIALNDRDTCELWKAKTTDWLISRFGKELAAIFEHEDENYPHLHAVLFPRICPTGQLDWSGVHPGRAAKAQSAARGESVAAQDAHYQRAMSEMQTDYYEAVSVAFGHYRNGPNRERRERHHHLEIRAAQEEIARLEAANRALTDSLAIMRRETAPLKVVDQQPVHRLELGIDLPSMGGAIAAEPAALEEDIDYELAFEHYREEWPDTAEAEDDQPCHDVEEFVPDEWDGCDDPGGYDENDDHTLDEPPDW